MYIINSPRKRASRGRSSNHGNHNNAKLQEAGMQIIDPVEHASRHGEEQDKYNDMVQAAEDQYEADFLAQAKIGDANALCGWASTVADRSNISGVVSIDKLSRRARTFAEVASDTLDLGNGPSMTELIQVLLNVASGLPETQTQAQDLIESLAANYAKYEVTE
jgi:hypothetical protein